MLDYIIVGAGLAGISFAELAIRNGKKIVVFENQSQPSSTVAGGMYNPVVLKRFTAIWKAQEQIDLANSFYKELESKLNARFNYPMPLWRKLASIEEQNNWFSAADKPKLSPFLNTTLQTDKINGIASNFGFGEVLNCGYLDTKQLLVSYQEYLDKLQLLKKETFDYDKIEISDEGISYKGILAKNLIFAEGFGLHQNPFFKTLPLDGTKGELLHVKVKNLDLDKIVKSGVFILPIGDDIYKVGATYDWQDKSNSPTEIGKKELIEKLNELVQLPYEIVEHLAGVRPTVNDRRPLVGSHPKHKNLFVLNGLGTRGVLLGPYLANSLFNTIENNVPLDGEIDCKRYFDKLEME